MNTIIVFKKYKNNTGSSVRKKQHWQHYNIIGRFTHRSPITVGSKFHIRCKS